MLGIAPCKSSKQQSIEKAHKILVTLLVKDIFSGCLEFPSWT
jgi:hypothetical protein